MLARCFAVLAFTGCQSSPPKEAPAPVLVEARDGSGAVVAQLRPGHPCRATIGPSELIIGGLPLIAQDGATRWSGDDRGNGTTVLRDGQIVARIVELSGVLSVVDPTGVAMVRIGPDAISDAGGRRLRTIAQQGKGFTIGDLAVTGTTDAVLAALLTAGELMPEVRMLAACERVLK